MAKATPVTAAVDTKPAAAVDITMAPVAPSTGKRSASQTAAVATEDLEALLKDAGRGATLQGNAVRVDN